MSSYHPLESTIFFSKIHKVVNSKRLKNKYVYTEIYMTVKLNDSNLLGMQSV